MFNSVRRNWESSPCTELRLCIARGDKWLCAAEALLLLQKVSAPAAVAANVQPSYSICESSDQMSAIAELEKQCD